MNCKIIMTAREFSLAHLNFHVICLLIVNDNDDDGHDNGDDNDDDGL